ncbi:helix-turn-helix domain-containing protein [Empedobacter falsenii]|uniref:helix-turn-helix domain-containing protein n=2 Tax=Empedobacter TaxID=59734 RepID=UPI001C55F896|nr:helix-turn-helix domain-containing protein [Empedobacter falsenii]MBW1619731.1 helix-turn-helix domain-containing protein [Empedobacter falsenii]
MSNFREDGLIFRKEVGRILRKKRIKLEYSLDDIVEMTLVSKSSIINVENGDSSNIDFIIEYSKAVGYDLNTLTGFGIKLKPLKELKEDKKSKISLTYKVKEYILNTNFLNQGKTIAEIKEELVRLKLVPKDITSVAIAGVMRNLKNDEVVSSEETTGRKAIYISNLNQYKY